MTRGTVRAVCGTTLVAMSAYPRTDPGTASVILFELSGLALVVAVVLWGRVHPP